MRKHSVLLQMMSMRSRPPSRRRMMMRRWSPPPLLRTVTAMAAAEATATVAVDGAAVAAGAETKEASVRKRYVTEAPSVLPSASCVCYLRDEDDTCSDGGSRKRR